MYTGLRNSHHPSNEGNDFENHNGDSLMNDLEKLETMNGEGTNSFRGLEYADEEKHCNIPASMTFMRTQSMRKRQYHKKKRIIKKI